MEKGLPRPRIEVNDKTYPLPYTAQDNSIANIEDSRMIECVSSCLCIVCGDEVTDERSLALLKRFGFSDDFVLFSESGPYHTKCAKMAFFLCPHINDQMFSLVEMDTQEILSYVQGRWRWTQPA